MLNMFSLGAQVPAELQGYLSPNIDSVRNRGEAS